MKKENKAQVSFYILLVVVIILISSLGFYFIRSNLIQKSSEAAIKSQTLNAEFLPVQKFTEECIKKAAIKSAYEFGQQQGYYFTKKPYLEAAGGYISYYYSNDSILIPPNSVFENEFLKIMDDNVLAYCTNFIIFQNLGYNISFATVNASAKILDDKVILKVDYPLQIQKDGASKTIKTFPYTMPFRIGHIMDVARELTDAVKKEPYALDLTLLLNFDLDISVLHQDSCNNIYIISDNESKTNPSQYDYIFFFATNVREEYCNNDLNFTNEVKIKKPQIENYDPVLQPIPYLIAEANKSFSYNLNASDEDNDTLFYLTYGLTQNKTNVLSGLIGFIPDDSQKGIYLINASVVDIKSGSDSKLFYLEIK